MNEQKIIEAAKIGVELLSAEGGEYEIASIGMRLGVAMRSLSERDKVLQCILVRELIGKDVTGKNGNGHATNGHD
jgi:hypothetical protein